MDVVIGIDTGTTATKGVAAGPRGEIRALTSVHYPLSVPGPGRAELDPAQLVDAAVKALTDVAAACRENGDRVIAIGLSAFLHALVPMSADGEPLGPLITWADGRSAGQCEQIVAAGRAKVLQARTGTPVHPMSPLTKLAWWEATDPDTLRGTPRWGGVKELIVAALTGGPFQVDLSLASGTGLYDIHSRKWDDEALGIAGVRAEQLAEVVPTTTRLRLRPEVARAAGLDEAVPLIIGAADGPLANLGVGATPAGIAAVSLGTSGALRTVVDRPASDEAGRLFCYALTEDRWVIGGAVNNAGSVVRWAGESFAAGFERPGAEGEDADERDAALLEEAAGVRAGSEGLLCLPYLLGERAPWWRPGLRGAYLGLRREHKRPHLVRAAVEGVCQQLALVRDSFEAEGYPVTEIRATGGAAASELWVSVLASALDLPVAVADTPEGTALGACLLARHALGEFPDLAEAAALVPISRHTRPEPEDAELYRRLRPLVEESALAVLDVVAELDRLAPEPLPGTEKAVGA
ncbi:putative FGGY-family carbohydrate kinase [Actinoplanes missouriensis 431]|uniref:Putative FGGY-family carbohydrate kinase n=1 Tax=Actinoplanes missouriensis (strain ATCC 14538 / DSM 43046 / CBS 188.64 / JCM 3121 / NBRC 102363 / NCIMB 12654 / NRRL B-3342 / UNCC 431) TaxID=512565 RepID=I0HCB5_ACTM4|nr:gluconokinase [Actinoplanes missouriensis]BAL90652.1 putative FGGY-family carbohydrate kinase [Actinoplanes missouriensis 431]